MQQFIEEKRDQIAELCRTHHVRRLSIFGSAVRDDFDPETSDVDIRVEFSSEAWDSYVNNLHALHDALVAIFGRKVDIVSGSPIRNRFFREEIEKTQVLMYAA